MLARIVTATVLAASIFAAPSRARDTKTLEVQAAGNSADPNCDITFPGALCVFGGKKVVLPDATQPGLTGRWTFDEVKPIDSSGNGNHAHVPGVPMPPSIPAVLPWQLAGA